MDYVDGSWRDGDKDMQSMQTSNKWVRTEV